MNLCNFFFQKEATYLNEYLYNFYEKKKKTEYFAKDYILFILFRL
jgi:hypothetical protein